MPDITREQVIEAIAKAIGIEHCASRSDDGICLAPNMQQGKFCICYQDAETALTAIEALGFKIVPYEPTHEQRSAGAKVTYSEIADRVYTAMLSASPLYREEDK